jgi:hypothetical protein
LSYLRGRRKPEYRVYVHADAQGMHHQQIFAGLSELDRSGVAAVDYTDLSVPDGPASTLWLQVEFEDCLKSVCYDMHDSGSVVGPERLHAADVYFKRSLTAQTDEGLGERDGRKLRPFGLNVHGVGHRDSGFFQRLWHEARIRRRRCVPLARGEWMYRILALASSYRPLAVPVPVKNRFIAKTQDLEASPQRALTGTVLFQTRLWPREVAPRETNLDELNDRRAQVVRALRATFGARFRGGLIPTPLAREKYPDCLTDLPTSQGAYLQELKQAQVGVVTRGLHGSVPWKLAECIASSRCVVSESSVVALPEPLQSGTNLLWFTDVDECLASVDHLLSNPTAATEMQRANAIYYERFVRPDRLVLNTLQAAFF